MEKIFGRMAKGYDIERRGDEFELVGRGQGVVDGGSSAITRSPTQEQQITTIMKAGKKHKRKGKEKKRKEKLHSRSVRINRFSWMLLSAITTIGRKSRIL
ncbi:hypothetical protein PM082_023855 [Marasmius tenuissimus]|nr:hypothetical protein PM082_023855 [Marasmius tenuissimus]